MADRSLLRLSVTLVVIGEVLFAIVTLFHADGPANNHPIVFAEYAAALVGSLFISGSSSLWLSSFLDCSFCPSLLMSDLEHWGGWVGSLPFR